MGSRWTDAEHALVVSMSEGCYSAEEIAAALGRSVAMIYKKRAELDLRPRRCAHCRTELDVPDPLPAGRPPQYCDEDCRLEHQWAYDYNALMEARPKTCAHCRAPLDLAQKVVRYCGRYCQQRAWWERARTDATVVDARRGHRREYMRRVRAAERAATTDVESAVS